MLKVILMTKVEDDHNDSKMMVGAVMTAMLIDGMTQMMCGDHYANNGGAGCVDSDGDEDVDNQGEGGGVVSDDRG